MLEWTDGERESQHWLLQRLLLPVMWASGMSRTPSQQDSLIAGACLRTGLQFCPQAARGQSMKISSFSACRWASGAMDTLLTQEPAKGNAARRSLSQLKSEVS